MKDQGGEMLGFNSTVQLPYEREAQRPSRRGNLTISAFLALSLSLLLAACTGGGAATATTAASADTTGSSATATLTSSTAAGGSVPTCPSGQATGSPVVTSKTINVAAISTQTGPLAGDFGAMEPGVKAYFSYIN